jgi:hypothetical protein
MIEATPKPNFFLDLIVTFLTPMFLAITGGNINHARAAAVETINAYRAETEADLLTVAQIIAFGIAALGSLSLAMGDNLSVSMILRLRGNAVSSNRAAEQSRRALQQTRTDNPAQPRPMLRDDPFPDEAAVSAEVEQLRQQTALPARSPAQSQPHSHAEPATNQDELNIWANSMIEVAAELTASLPHLSPDERRDASIRAAALSEIATELLAGKAPELPPRLNPAPS